MENIITPVEEVNVLVVGNNPTELGHVFDSLGSIPGKRCLTEIAFDLKSILERLTKFTPTFILIDDNIGRSALKTAVRALLKLKKTKSIPITIIKNSNYEEAINTGVLNYVLKAGLTGESLYRALMASAKSVSAQEYLYQAFKKRRGQMLRVLKSEMKEKYNL